jgi:hypothetical protein
MRILQAAHWSLPWVILVLGMVAMIRFSRSALPDAVRKGVDRRIMTGLAILLDLQAMFGLIYFLWAGYSGAGFPAHRILHGIIMLVAVFIIHLSKLWNDADDQTRFTNNLYILLASFILMLVGISLIPTGLSR